MKSILACSLLMLSFSAFCQIEKGQSFITGNGGLSVSKEDDLDGGDKTTNYNLGARCGYMTSDVWAIGLGLSFTGKTTDYGNYSRHNPHVDGSFFVRRYIPIAEKFYLHVDGDLMVGSTKFYDKSKGGDKSNESQVATFGISISPGASYFLTQRLALTAQWGSIGYGQVGPTGSKSNLMAVNFNFTSLSLGALMFFGRSE